MIHKFEKFNEKFTSVDSLFMGKPIQWWFPWYTYPNSLNTTPTKNEEIFDVFLHNYTEAKFNYVWNTDGDVSVGVISKGMSGNRMFLRGNKVIFNGVYLHVDNWCDVEKFRLSQLYNNDQEDTDMWISLLEFYHKNYQDITDYFLDDIELNNITEMYIVTTDSDMVDRVYNVESDVKDEILQYSGKNEFLVSLKKWIASGKELTYKQKNAAEKVLRDTQKTDNKGKGKPCLYVKFEDVSSIDRVMNRMSNTRFKYNTHDDCLLVWE